MESDGDEPGNIFEENENLADNGVNGNAADTSTGERVVPPKRIVKNPRLKFNPERLCGERGIPVLVDHFKNVKFKGKGHEREDLDKLMGTLEHWTHRLFPSMKFQDCLNQIERLGKKRPVQTCLTKIRMDMPILFKDFIKDDDEDNVLRNEDLDPEPENIDPFDRLLSESQGALESPMETLNAHGDLISFNSDNNVGQVLGSSFGSKITEDQRKIMERNRELAMERRKAKLALQSNQMNTSDLQPRSDQANSCSFDNLVKSSPIINDDTSNIGEENIEKEHDMKLVPNSQNFENLGLDVHTEGDDYNQLPISSGSYNDMESTVNIVSDDSKNSKSAISLEETVPLNVSCFEKNISSNDILNKERNDFSDVSESIQDEYLGLESLMDLVDEG